MEESFLNQIQYEVLHQMFDGDIPMWVLQECTYPIESQWLDSLEDRMVFDLNWRIQWEQARSEISPLFQAQLLVLPNVISSENVIEQIRTLKEIKASFFNRIVMFFYRWTMQYKKSKKQYLQRIESLKEKKSAFEQKMKERDDRERIARMSSHEKTAILIMFLKKETAAHMLRQMTDEDVREVTLLMATMERPTRAMIENVVQTFIIDLHSASQR